MGLFGSYTEVPFSQDLGEIISITEKLLEGGVEKNCEASFSYGKSFRKANGSRKLRRISSF